MKSGRNNKLNKRQSNTYFLISENGYQADPDTYNSKCYVQKLAKQWNKEEFKRYGKICCKVKAVKY